MYQNRIELLDLDYHSLKKYIYKLLRVESFTWFPFAVNPTDFYLGMIMSMGEYMDHPDMFLCHKSRYINQIDFFL